jgi:hypothetical protein
MCRQLVAFAIAILTLFGVAWARDPEIRDFDRAARQSLPAAVEPTGPVRDEAVMVLIGAALIGLAAAVRRAA